MQIGEPEQVIEVPMILPDEEPGIQIEFAPSEEPIEVTNWPVRVADPIER